MQRFLKFAPAPCLLLLSGCAATLPPVCPPPPPPPAELMVPPPARGAAQKALEAILEKGRGQTSAPTSRP